MNSKQTQDMAQVKVKTHTKTKTRTRFTRVVIGLVLSLVLGLIIGALITLGLVELGSHDKSLDSSLQVSSSKAKTESKPLYWVAPMDANYQRDKPGKSPMGMDLIPYYGNTNQGNEFDEGPGTIEISPSVINNLGVRTVTAVRQALNTEIKTVGYVSYNEDKLVHIHPRVEGWIEKLYIQAIGDPVEKNQPLYDIYSPELVNAQEEFLLALERKNKRLITAAQNRLVALQLPPSAIKALKITKKVKQFVTFYAPESGVVESLSIREGFYVKPETMMLSIVDLSHVWLKAEIFEKDIIKVAMGNSAIMHLDYFPAREWSGEVSHIHPMLNPKTRTGIVRLHFDNNDHYLKPNMLAQVIINVSDNLPVLQIPREALIRTGNQDRVVLALGEGYFKSIEVKVGRFDNNHVEILSGLKEGEEIVSSAQFLLDSESSKSSDFKRMETIENYTEAIDKNTTKSVHNEAVSSASVHGTVTSVMPNHRMVTIDRQAIEKWNRPAASVDFIVDETVDMSVFTKGAQVMFTFEIHNGEFIIIGAILMKTDKPHGAINDLTQGQPSSHSSHSHEKAHAVEEGMNKVYTK
jgi:Cu(I)/Ag(I) efflux system membrane fusion protein